MSVVGGLFLGRENTPFAKRFEDVIHRGERKAGMLRLHPLAVRVQLLAQGPDARLRRFVAGGDETKTRSSEKSCCRSRPVASTRFDQILKRERRPNPPVFE